MKPAAIRNAAMVVGALALLSFISIETPEGRTAASASGGGPVAGAGHLDSGGNGVSNAPGEGGASSPGDTTAGGAPSDGAGGGAGGGGETSATDASGQRFECRAGANGGGTDTGVSANAIKIAATNVRSGIGSSFLGTAYVGMQAVVNRVNGAGGICGRLLDLRLVDDGWRADLGNTYIQNFIQEGYFALPVVPSSEGLTQAITNGTISTAGIPVIGTDGMLKEQYGDPFVWPVATATVSTMRVMARHAYDSGAKTFGIVFDAQYRFGKEGAEAFRQYVRQLTGSDPKAYVGIQPGLSSYSGEANRFNTDCGGDGCDFVAMLLDPTTANTYIKSQTDRDGRRQGFGRMLTGGAQPLFNESFARDCGAPCEGMLVWTGYNPPVGRLAALGDVAQYVDDVRSVDSRVDVNNQFLEGAYLGMQVFVAALEKVGPNLTRAALRDAMNSLSYESDLASPLVWSGDRRFANQGAQAFRIVTSTGQFAGFSEAGTGFIQDPTPGVVPG